MSRSPTASRSATGYRVAVVPASPPEDLTQYSGSTAVLCSNPEAIAIPFVKVTTVEHDPGMAPQRPAAHMMIRLEAPGVTLEDLRTLEAEAGPSAGSQTLGEDEFDLDGYAAGRYLTFLAAGAERQGVGQDWKPTGGPRSVSSVSVPPGPEKTQELMRSHER